MSPVSLRTFLSQLGSTKEAVAETLDRRGIRGEPKSYLDCPIAHAIERRWPKDVLIVRQDTISTGECANIMLPRPVRLFIKAFDRGLFPHLRSS